MVQLQPISKYSIRIIGYIKLRENIKMLEWLKNSL